jgi:hypothetical protein
MKDSVRIFVACSRSEWLPRKVLEFSIRETTKLPVQVTAIGDFERAIPVPKEARNRPRTPFSFQRFLIPELCGFQGRAIYLDADMQVFTDIGDLWNAPMDGNDLLAVSEGTAGRRGQYSVVLLDCARLGWKVEDIVRGLDEGRFTYEQLMYEMCVAADVGRTLDPAWNSLERFTPGVTRLLHYTDMDTQPWVSLDNSLQALWVSCLRRAIDAGFITAEDLRRETALGHVRPSLVAEVLHGEVSPAQLRMLDQAFVAPYHSIRSGRFTPWLSWRGRVNSIARRGLQRMRSLVER